MPMNEVSNNTPDRELIGTPGPKIMPRAGEFQKDLGRYL